MLEYGLLRTFAVTNFYGKQRIWLTMRMVINAYGNHTYTINSARQRASADRAHARGAEVLFRVVDAIEAAQHQE